eukprot:Skav223620  [mRNA]  locus=scaffold3504:8139:17768:- [translate_table: standard]
MNILAFSDSMGYCKNLLANAPEGRISMKKVVENYHTLTQEDVKRLVTEPKKGWDMVIFAVGCDPPRSNSIDDVIEQNTVISRLYFWLSYEIQRAEGSARKIFCLVRGLFHEDTKTHMKAGLGITVCGTLFGMTNTLRQEPGMVTACHGMYVQKRISSKLYQAANKDAGMAEQGKSGFSIQFLSRSMKISDLNMPLWKDIEAKAAKLGVTVEQGRKMDMSSMEGCCKFIEKLNGELSKHHAALYLHYALEQNPQKDFRFMWNFSSTSVYGNMGQLNYSGSNSFLDVLTRHRKAKGRPSLAIQWGAWGDVGMAATMTDAMRLRRAGSKVRCGVNN